MLPQVFDPPLDELPPVELLEANAVVGAFGESQDLLMGQNCRDRRCRVSVLFGLDRSGGGIGV
jgi:hypothetical protein